MLDHTTKRQLDDAARLIEQDAYDEAFALCRVVGARGGGGGEHLVLIADICVRRDAPDRALEFIDAALSAGASGVRAFVVRAEALEALNLIGEACAEAERAYALSPSDPRSLLVLARIFLACGRQNEARSCCARAASIAPRDAGVRLQLATCLHVDGEIEAAQRIYREALTLDQALPLAWLALTQSKAFALSADEVALVEVLRADCKDSADSLVLAHAIAKGLEDSGDYAAALETLKAPKRARKQAINYAFADDAELFQVARRSHRLLQGAAVGDPDMTPIFVVGMPRSGTTLVERILASHDEVSSAGETDEFWVTLKRLARTPSRRALDAETLSAAAALDPRQLGSGYLSRLATRTAARKARIVDKMPLNFFCAGLILNALPNARIICVRRHAADTCIANYAQYFTNDPLYYGYVCDLEDIARYYLAFDSLSTHWRTVLPPDRFTELHYEQLIGDQEGETRRLLAFCDLPWDPRCLKFHELPGQIRTASAVQARRPLHSESIGRWRRYVPALDPMLGLLRAAGAPVD
jgi:Flp pilus assembly protein TadD